MVSSPYGLMPCMKSVTMHEISPDIDKISGRLDVNGAISLENIGQKRSNMSKSFTEQFRFHLKKLFLLYLLPLSLNLR